MVPEFFEAPKIPHNGHSRIHELIGAAPFGDAGGEAGSGPEKFMVTAAN